MNLTLHLTADCNLRCRYCYETHCKNRMTWDTAKQAVDLVFSYGHKTNGLSLFGGEPLLERALTEEICRYANIAHLPMSRLQAGADVRDFLERADFGAVCRGHRERFDHYVDFLNKNGVPHIWVETPEPEVAPFDEAMKRVPAGGCVRRGCLPATEVARRRLAHYSVAAKWKLKKIRRRLGTL